MANTLVMDDEQPFVICPIQCSAANAGSLIIRDMKRAIWSLPLNNASTDVIPSTSKGSIPLVQCRSGKLLC